MRPGIASLAVVCLLAGSRSVSAQPSRCTEVDELIKAVLARSLRRTDALPDAGLLPKTGPVLVRAEIAGRPPVSRCSLPARARRRLVIRPGEWLQNQADQRGRSVAFIAIDEAVIDGNNASVVLGVDLVLPATDRSIKLCCCSGQQRWVKRRGRWRFQAGGAISCG